MPVAPTYPGVYVEEIPSGVHTIVGVATSITAFVGRTVSGPANTPVTIYSFADFDRQFGGIDIDYPLSYAVNDFYQNGGSQAIIVRVTSSAALAATLSVNGLNLVASSPGSWGNALQVTVDNLNITDKVAQRYGPAMTAADLFNLTVVEKVGTQVLSQERFLNLTFKPDDPSVPAAARSQRVDRVLIQSSQLLRLALKKDGITPDLPTATPLPKAPAASTKGAAAATTGAAPAAGDSGAAAATGTGKAAAAVTPAAAPTPAPTPVQASGGADDASLKTTDILGSQDQKTGIYALETADLFNLLCIPPDIPGGDTDPTVYSAAMTYCQSRRAVLIVDPPAAWSSNPVNAAANAIAGLGSLNLTGDSASYAALYFPRVVESDPRSNGQLITVPPCGIVAGVMARTDLSRGVWKAPAGVDATLTGISGLEVNLTNLENGTLNPLAINCIRNFPVIGSVVWGARTMAGADQLADDYKYLPVRRLALYIEESLYRGTQWVVFEPNDNPLWASIRLNVGAFMHNLFVQGAFQGQAPAEAYFVACDATTNPQNQIDLGIVNVVVGFAPLKPAEFVVLQIQQIAGNILT